MTEKLTSVRLQDGLWHAIYPTATRTLCGRVTSKHRGPGRKWPPTCATCAAVAVAFHRIDGSAPRHWKLSRHMRAAA